MKKFLKYFIVLFLLFTLTGCIEKHSDVRVKVESNVIQRGDWQKNSNYNPFFDLEFIVNDDWKIYSDKELIDAFPLAKAVANQRGEFEDVEKKDVVFCYFVKEKTNNTNISAIIIKLRDEEEQKLNEETYMLGLMNNIDDGAKSYKMSDAKRIEIGKNTYLLANYKIEMKGSEVVQYYILRKKDNYILFITVSLAEGTKIEDILKMYN